MKHFGLSYKLTKTKDDNVALLFDISVYMDTAA